MSEQQQSGINVFWFLPTHGDGRYLGTAEGGVPLISILTTNCSSGRLSWLLRRVDPNGEKL